MTPEAQRIAIAEACGWHGICHYDYSNRFSGHCTWPEHIKAKVRAEDEQRGGWRGYPPGTKERLESERAALRRSAEVMPNCVVQMQGGWLEQQRLPDYRSDLNTMHEAEKTLTPDQMEAYAHTIFGIITSGGRLPYRWPSCLIEATAAQRAEAFLKTLNLWEDSP